MKKVFIKFLIALPIIMGVFAIITLSFALLDTGTLWESLEKDGNVTSALQYISLILYRLLIYLLPAVVLWLTSKRFKTKKYGFLECLNFQFAIYTILKCMVVLFALDYLLSIKMFNAMNNYVVIFGYVITLISKKKADLGKIDLLEKENAK
ncbi:MAG: hypothetical protein LBQ40_02510 [Clostridiales bacterium]|jgi:uncharacterized membrane protein|nr:hypothetical protein [Clostridiales bacterium]